MIKLVLFDLGNVLLPFDVHRLAKRLTSHSPLNADQIIQNLWNDHIANTFETGKMDGSAYFDTISAACQFKGLTYNQFLPIFNDIFDENKDVGAIVKELKPHYKMGVISNTNPVHADHVVKTYPILSHFDQIWFSNDAGTRKPDPAIYQMALDHFNEAPEKTVFIDDLHVNVVAAKQLGLHGIHFQDADQLKAALAKLNMKIQSKAA